MKLPVSMHSFGSALHFAASLHMAASLVNTERVESEENVNPLRTKIIKQPFVTNEKMDFILRDEHGLGIDIDWNEVCLLTVKR
ncbi:enolase C-terminal domain-like protein [Martelella alba]|nr:enolase C-terminal domain-like protein [Martelella alba]